jgi:hypothetical protein
MSIYSMLIDNNHITNEEFIRSPHRVRKKVSGWMWKAEYKVTSHNGIVFMFYMWNHFDNDNDSSEWTPSLEDIKKYMFCKSVNYKGHCYDFNWHTLFINGTYYISKKGFFNNNKYKNEIIEEIKNGNWKENYDIEDIFQN